jgi:hypothetical protein
MGACAPIHAQIVPEHQFFAGYGLVCHTILLGKYACPLTPDFADMLGQFPVRAFETQHAFDGTSGVTWPDGPLWILAAQIHEGHLLLGLLPIRGETACLLFLFPPYLTAFLTIP